MTLETTETDCLVIRLHDSDNIVVAREELPAGCVVDGGSGTVSCREPIPAGHKLASRSIAAGEGVFKYGQLIGLASSEIAAGSLVHSHNLTMGEFDRRLAAGAEPATAVPQQARSSLFFQGYRRADGGAGTRNHILVLSTVNCSATVCRGIADAFRGDALEAFPNVDGVVACTHAFGCMSNARLARVLAGYARHPNVAGFLMVGLGCESNSIGAVAASHALPEHELARYLVIQQQGGTRSTIDEGIALVRGMLPLANRCRREPIPLSELVVGLECGGSDAYSGMSANPALGRAADLLVEQGGTAVLSETPEIFGAEHLLTHRAATPEIAERLLRLLDWWRQYAAANGVILDNNPSAGNRAGGLTTIIEKSLGAVAKGGSSPLRGVYDYAEALSAKGLVFMDTPGYDPASVTGMIAGGANLICFTTGRGSVFGSKPVPSIKIASNSRLFHNMRDDMDLDAGLVLAGEESVDSMGRIILDAVIATASGQQTKSELNGYGDEEFTPWHVGALL
ncbi:MAG: altronate dehydratase [Gammaproteobacteria bacterium]|nr:altronate dehydratase [Gammaproteobacteria bacterium]